jgi:KTSC domain-containing protein
LTSHAPPAGHIEQLASVGYDAGTYVLEVEFTNGHVYQYFDVPESVYEEFMSSGSLGNYLNSQIKPNYRYAQQ